MKWLKEFVYKLKVRAGWCNCPSCHEFVKPQWVKDVVLFEDEPPMFFHYKCPKCGLETDTHPSCITEKAVKSLGYKSFDDYYEREIKPVIARSTK